jgi:hypothetical protein
MTPGIRSTYVHADDVRTVMRTLAVNGFTVSRVTRRSYGMLVYCERIDLFGTSIPYVVVMAERDLSAAELTGALRTARNQGSNPILVGGDASGKMAAFSLAAFEAKLGGPIDSFLPLERSYGERLRRLGSNTRVDGLTGDPEDLYEKYVYAGLQFVLNSRVVRYGQRFTGAILPDGVAIVAGRPLFMYDAKASARGYTVSRDAIRQFADYIRRFHSSYETYLGRLNAFVVLSTAFQATGTKVSRSAELHSECGVPLVYMSSATLAHLVAVTAKRPILRGVMRWPEIFAPPEATKLAIDKAVRSINREQIAVE